jgi:uncharacterized protein YjiS (DUF1127 family)
MTRTLHAPEAAHAFARPMSRTLSAPGAAHTLTRPSHVSRLAVVLKAWWAAYQRRRAERLMSERLRGMSDRELKDIGIVRSQIDFAVTRGIERHRIVDLGP